MPDIPWDMGLSESVEGRILEAVRQRLLTVDLPGIGQEKFVVQNIQWQPDEVTLPPPYVIVSPAPETTPWQEGANETDDTTFAVLVSVVVANTRELTRGLGLQLYWRQNIRRKFLATSIARFTQLGLPDGVFLTHGWVESGDKFIEAAKRDMRDAQYFMLRFRVKEPRE